MRRLTAINFINQFFWAVIAITLPLYLLQKNINVEEIGLILSLIPLTMVFSRTLLAMVSDVLGTRIFFMMQGVFQALSAGTYAISSIPLHFGIGKTFEGISYSFFWAVDRTAIFRTAKKRGIEAAKMTSVRMVAGGIGFLFGGYIAYLFSFEAVYLFLVLLGLLTFILAAMRHDNEANHDEKIAQTLELDKKHLLFWEAAFVLGFAVVYDSVFLGFLLPVFMDISLNLDYAIIGLGMAIYFAGLGIGSYIAAKVELVEKRLLPFQLLMIPLLALLPYSGGFFIPLLFLVGLGSGIVFAMYEEVVAEITKDDRNLSTSVALLNLPGKIMEFFILASAGFILVLLGNEALFALCALLLLVYIIFTHKILKKLAVA
ncbi:MFS transporter [Candidatus Micrarchaeota archaeon]|nr:MFS transporter [Candidatus Micrarchaeota archaeon]